jgi:MoaA/NifB/PqqE/SkfB family radical SAM enzyme
MSDSVPNLAFVWLEITGKCQLECVHCYADSSPAGTRGKMAAADWRRVIDQAVGLGVGAVQFNGGEPTLHPDLPELVRHALSRGLKVEVFSNLEHVTPALWDLFSLAGVSLATSYYSDDPRQHAVITRRSSSHARTKANIVEAVRRGIPLRAGVIDLGHRQHWKQAVAELEDLGVSEIRVDRLREVGRGVRSLRPSMDQLCGQCAARVLAIRPDGTVMPCVFARWPAMFVGNVLESSLDDIVEGSAAAAVRKKLAKHFRAAPRRAPRGAVRMPSKPTTPAMQRTRQVR